LTDVEISSPELHTVNVLTAYYSGCGVEQNEARLQVSLDIFHDSISMSALKIISDLAR
jgi:hypothetical protein